MIPFAITFYLIYLWLTVLPLAHNVTLTTKESSFLIYFWQNDQPTCGSREALD